jgi:Xaa-Pro aminopeptidase
LTTQLSSPSRLARLTQALPAAGLDGLILNPGPGLAYLIGVHFFLFERPIVAFFTPDKTPALVLPALEVTKAQSAPLDLQLFPYQDNPATWARAFQQACQFLGWDRRQLPPGSKSTACACWKAVTSRRLSRASAW